MDVIEHLPEEQRSERGSADIRDSTAPSLELEVLSLRSIEQIEGILRRYAELRVPKQDVELFKHHLIHDRAAWFLSVGDVGLIYFTRVIPHVSAELNIIFWDGKLPKERMLLTKQAVKMAVEYFDLNRVGAHTRWDNNALKRFLKGAGLIYEGTVRRGWVDGEGVHDLLLFGVIREEI